MRIHILYENIMGKGLGFEQMQSYSAVISLYYAAIVASLQYHKRDSNVTYDEFIDWLDENNTTMKEFTEWFIKCMTAQADKVDETVNKEVNEETVKKSKK